MRQPIQCASLRFVIIGLLSFREPKRISNLTYHQQNQRMMRNFDMDPLFINPDNCVAPIPSETTLSTPYYLPVRFYPLYSPFDKLRYAI